MKLHRYDFAVKLNCILSIPLRMKLEFDTVGTCYRPNSFNSFEDETVEKIIKYLDKLNFQFLWGWNTITRHPLGGVEYLFPFNSFEDETEDYRYRIKMSDTLSIPLRMKLSKGHDTRDPHHITLSIPLRMKLVKSISVGDKAWNRLSIPLRMKRGIGNTSTGTISEAFNSFEDETEYYQ